jgi:poly-beta-1,6-N-acetyl-D-glucosamine synthase
MYFYHLLQLLAQSWEHEFQKLTEWPNGTLACLGDFVCYFPLLLSLSWSFSVILKLSGALFRPNIYHPRNSKLPTFSILIPFYGDADEAMRSLSSLRQLTPAPDEIFLIDDGSPYPCAMPDFTDFPAKVTLIKLPYNVGKANALNQSLSYVSSDVIVCLDADTMAATSDWSGMLSRFSTDKSLAAVTGKIRPKSVKNLVQLMQAIDYLAVICMVKCAESLWGGLTTVSGAWVAYRRQALIQAGGWNSQTSAEDIDLSWRLQSGGWHLQYDINWTAHVGMAPRWTSLWFQRKRWSSGMAKTLRGQHRGVFRKGARHGIVALLAVLGCLWMVSSLVLTLFSFIKSQDYWLPNYRILFSVGAAAFLLQLVAGILVDRDSWKRYPLIILISPLYPLYFWAILFTSNIAGLFHGFFLKDNGKWQPTNNLGTNRAQLTQETQSTPHQSWENPKYSIISFKSKPTTDLSNTVPKDTVRTLVQAFLVQSTRLFLVGLGVLCFYTALSIILKLQISSATYKAAILHLCLGILSWTAACWRYRSRHGLRNNISLPIEVIAAASNSTITIDHRDISGGNTKTTH